MTRETCRTQLYTVKLVFMATVASDAGVFPFQPVFGITVVGEYDITPFFGRMAGLAFFTITAVMYVIDPVTGDTLDRNVLVTLVGVTTFACSIPVFPF